MREYKDTKKACSPVKNKLHAFVYIDDNVYINARGKVSLMCVCVCAIQKSETAKFTARFFTSAAEELLP